MLLLVGEITEIDDPLADPETTKQALSQAVAACTAAQEERYRLAGGREPDDLEFEKWVVLEAIDLRLALPTDPAIRHAFTFDGSITLTLGPCFPACGALGLRGSDGEMLDEPRDILEAARRATTCAGELAHEISLTGPLRTRRR